MSQKSKEYELPVVLTTVGRKEDNYEIMELLWNTSEECLVMNGKHPALAFSFIGDQMMVVEVNQIRNHSGILRGFLRSLTENDNVYAVAVASEVLIKQKTSGIIHKVNNTLQVMVEMRGVPGTFLKMADIVRRDDGQVFRLENHRTQGGVATGVLCNLFPTGES